MAEHPHSHFMHTALGLARSHLGQTWPNPSVGAVIVKDGHVIGHGVTARGGRPHAETEALAQAGDLARGATMYVTLEPCSHHGKTSPCVDAIIKAGITHVVVACRDPNPKVNGRGIAQLEAAGITVTEDMMRREAAEINCGFFSVIHKKRPFVSLKLATSLDGKIATYSGESQWITGEEARRYGHFLRSRYDAVATGIGTVLADDPMLTCRLPGLEDTSPVRVVFDRQGRLPAHSKLAKSADKIPLWIMKSGLEEAMAELVERGITRLLVEAGGKLSTAFLQSGLVDRMYWFRAPLMIGNDGVAAISDGITPTLSQATRWQTIETRILQSDTLSILECSPASSAA